MKKKLFLGVAVLSAAAMLCGFDSAETVESLSEKMNEASASMESMSADMGMNVDAAISISDGTTTTPIDIMLKADLAIDYLLDPFAMQMDGTMELSALGSGENMAEKAYMVSDENGDLKMYVYVEDGTGTEGEWAVQTMEGMNIQELMEASKNSTMNLAELSDWGMTFELAPEAADVDGTECYLLSTSIDADSLTTILQKASELTGQDLMNDDVNTVLSLMTGLKLNIAYYVDTTTYLPVKVHMDMNNSDLTMINTLVNAYLGSAESEDAPASTAELILNDVSIDMMTSYNTGVEITVPQEALDAEAAGAADTESLADLAEAVVEAESEAVAE